MPRTPRGRLRGDGPRGRTSLTSDLLPDRPREEAELIRPGRTDLARLSAAEAEGYDAVVAGMTPRIERSLGPEVVANRAMGRGGLRTTQLEPWRSARTAWRRGLATALATSETPAVLVADVRRCYASIHPAVLDVRLRALGVSPTEVARLRALLERVGEVGVRGLPVGPAPSAILANAVLAAVDDRLRGASVPHRRWVDDVVAFAAGRNQAVAAFDAFRRGLDDVGLEPNPLKTEILTDRDRVRERLLRLRPSTGGTSAVG